jgi:alpha-D-ribose 1-methylphosphonate 5-triphosphate synthase subunit PhnL
MHDDTMLRIHRLSKHFVLHTQGGVRIPVLDRVSFELKRGECLVLDGPSGAGKSTLLRCLYANYLPSEGELWVREAGSQVPVNLASATLQQIIELRRSTLSYVSQFLRVIPRVSSLEIVAEPLLALGEDPIAARQRAASLLARLNLPERLCHLPPATFSGGEQQRVNIARGFVTEKPVLLLDEPTASLDAGNRDVVISLIRETCARGTAIVGIFHDAEVREQVATSRLAILPAATAAIAAAA